VKAAALGLPRLHLRRVDSTNSRARELALAGAPHGTLVTADEQTAGRGRQGRRWTAPAGRALLCSVLIREPPRLLPLTAGVVVAETVDAAVPAGTRSPAQVKWPNDVLMDGRKLAGILVEGRPQERWAVVGVGLNVALRAEDFPPELRSGAGTMELAPSEIEPTLERLVSILQRWMTAPEPEVLEAVRARDALRGRQVKWAERSGIAEGIDDAGRLLVVNAQGNQIALGAGEVHLTW
jgi:BirA family biotin operon repressor/biotin-[acetyl-CoA-carboxylase] ligase